MQRIALLVNASLLSVAVLFAAAASDSKFVKEASEGSLAEIELGQLAHQKAQNQAVRDFASHMVTDHTKANDELRAAAAADNISVATSLSVSDEALKLKLKALSGATFDKSYMSAMVKDHMNDIAAFEKEAGSGEEARIKNFASKTLPTLRNHLFMAEKAAETVGAK